MIFSGLRTYYHDKITYDEPHTSKKSIRKAKCQYEQIKGRQCLHKAWKSKLRDKEEHRKKGSKPPNVRGNQNKYSKGKIPSRE